MTTGFEPGQSLGIASVPNLRDLGGWPGRDGTVKPGVLFRSANFAGLAGDDLAAFDRLGIATVYDFRTEGERKAQPDTLPVGVEYVVLDVMRDSKSQSAALMLNLFQDPQAAEWALGGGKAQALFENGYRELIDLPSARAGYRQFFTDLADGHRLPAVFHCTGGKDRTGWAAAATLMLLGVPEGDVMKDFLLTNEQLTAFTKPVADKFASMGGDPELLDPVLGARKEYLLAGIDEMRVQYGDIEGYFTAGLGLDRSTIDALRRALTQPAEA